MPEMPPWNPRIEEMPIDELQRLQFKLLKSQVYRLYSFNEFYRRRMKEHGVHPDDIRNLEDLAKLPFMYKSDLRDGYPDKIFAVERSELVRYHVSSGTTGKPTVVGYTERDIANWSESLARAFSSCGLGRGDVVQVSYGYGLFTGGLGAHYGAERLGATVLPTSVGNTERQVELMQDLHVTAIACTPSYLLHIGEVAEKMGISIRDDTDLQMGFLGAEPWSEQMRTRIQDWLGIRAYDIYGTSELSGPMFTECSEQQGIHIWGDLALLEVVDPATGEVLEAGEEGELVFTTITKEAFPAIRFRTRDIAEYTEESCACGRTLPVMSRIKGRSDDMMKVKGVIVFPSQIEAAMMGVAGVSGNYQLVKKTKNEMTTLAIRVEPTEQRYTEGNLDEMAQNIEEEVYTILNLRIPVEVVKPNTLPRSEGKAKRVVEE